MTYLCWNIIILSRPLHNLLYYLSSTGEGTVNSNNVGLRILAGVTTGGAAVLCAQPTDVVKVRLQAAAGKARYNGCFNAYKTIAFTEGTRGLWKDTLI